MSKLRKGGPEGLLSTRSTFPQYASGDLNPEPVDEDRVPPRLSVFSQASLRRAIHLLDAVRLDVQTITPLPLSGGDRQPKTVHEIIETQLMDPAPERFGLILPATARTVGSSHFACDSTIEKALPSLVASPTALQFPVDTQLTDTNSAPLWGIGADSRSWPHTPLLSS